MTLAEAKARFQSGEIIPPTDPAFAVVMPIVGETLQLIGKLNASGDIATARSILSEIFDQKLDESTTVFPPFTTNFGRFTTIGKNVFINHGCSFLDLGGITIEDEVLIGPQVKLVTENHPLDPETRKGLITKPILIKQNAWIGAGATILPGVTVGENAVVAAGAVVSKDVPANTVVGGIPAKLIKSIG
jgi:acetyltransferase-like isoleucine patch superfamily enzyme